MSASRPVQEFERGARGRENAPFSTREASTPGFDNQVPRKSLKPSLRLGQNRADW